MDTENIAEQVAEQRELVRALGMANTPADETDRMRASIRYEIAVAKLAVLVDRLQGVVKAEMRIVESRIAQGYGQS